MAREGSRGGMAIKVYVVFQRQNLPREGQPNVKALAAKLTREAAQAIVDCYPGTWIEKFLADKVSGLETVQPVAHHPAANGDGRWQSRHSAST